MNPGESNPTSSASRDHFYFIVQNWSNTGPPLRPRPADSAIVQRVVDDVLPPASRVVVLGLTPEIVGCNWPQGTHLTAVDHSPAMINLLWPPAKGPPGAHAILADWCAMPLDSHTLDLVAGDGCYIVMTHPAGFATLTREVHRVLKVDGLFVIRVFTRPDQPQSLQQIAGDFADGNIESVHVLKLRLLASLHGRTGEGSRLADVWDAWKTLPPVPEKLQGVRGWSDGELLTIESYRGLETRYYLPTDSEFHAAVEPWFETTNSGTSAEQWAAFTRTFVLVPRVRNS